ncbi:MAG: hypothetical protein ACK5QD_07535 [Brevundimonas sp.]|uniref:hypothetical protein n=1 Tax=Brevundimonas sp. TaxID=1871086 RepID=UPI00391CE070
MLEAAGAEPELAASLTGDGPFLLLILPDSSMAVVSGSDLPSNRLRAFGVNWVVAASAIYEDRSRDTREQGCLDDIRISLNDLGGQVAAFVRCRFPEGVTVAHARVPACVLARLAGWPTLGLCPQLS